MSSRRTMMGKRADAALERARKNGLLEPGAVRPVGPGKWVVRSGSDPDASYLVQRTQVEYPNEATGETHTRDVYECPCRAGQNGIICQHGEAARHYFEHPPRRTGGFGPMRKEAPRTT